MVIVGNWENPTWWAGPLLLTLQHGVPAIRPCQSACSRRFSCLNPSNVEGLHRLPEQNVTVSYSVITGVKLRFLTITVPSPRPRSCYKSLSDVVLPILILQLLPQTSANGSSLRCLSRMGLHSWEKEKASWWPWGDALESRKDQKLHVGRGFSKNRRGLCPPATGRQRLSASVCSDTGTGVNFTGRQRSL